MSHLSGEDAKGRLFWCVCIFVYHNGKKVGEFRSIHIVLLEISEVERGGHVCQWTIVPCEGSEDFHLRDCLQTGSGTVVV